MESVTQGARYMTWVNDVAFESGFYFADVRSPRVDLEFVVEGAEPVTISGVSAHAHPDAMCREFEHGVVLANPSPRPYRFHVGTLFLGQAFRRLQGSASQDPETNNGRPAARELTLGPKDALFLVKTPSGK
jgi:hypothetical protein